MGFINNIYFKVSKSKFFVNFVDQLLNFLFIPLGWYLHCTRKKLKKNNKYYISICAIFKNEGCYIKEWIEYHKLIGIDHIYLYNNFSDDNYHEILDSYIEEGFVTLTEWPYKYSQMEAYHDCYIKYKCETFWLTFIDLDEFICPRYKYNIKDWIKDYEGYPAVTMYWQMFGTCGKMKPDYSKLVIEQYTSSWEKLDGIGKYFLCTDERFALKNILSHHHIFVRYKIGFVNIKLPMINENRRFIFFPMLYKSTNKNTIQLNHYFSKSYEEYRNKINKGDVYSISHEDYRKSINFFINHEKMNISDNKVIFKYLTLLKEQMNRE